MYRVAKSIDELVKATVFLVDANALKFCVCIFILCYYKLHFYYLKNLLNNKLARILELFSLLYTYLVIFS